MSAAVEGTTGRRNRSKAERLTLEIVGWLLVAVGIAALVLPGPGMLILALGLWVHSLSYKWAEDLLEPVKRNGMRAAAEGVETWPRIAMSTTSALVMIAVGVYWGISPAAPGWWPVDEKWWLMGGWGTAGFIIGSGVIAIGLIGFSMKHFRYGGEDVEEYVDERWPDDD
ncbi:PGPGW domain-containing protein [Nocardioides ferulae]|uniref:PGPGW domain-containing protein n=1 Tax=Nocardioides ferulae TaxID=2340821 RepID=UPI001F0C4266|nr:PGPGW domain-containing protein [Nocardioides ferulae]